MNRVHSNNNNKKLGVGWNVSKIRFLLITHPILDVRFTFLRRYLDARKTSSKPRRYPSMPSQRIASNLKKI